MNIRSRNSKVLKTGFAAFFLILLPFVNLAQVNVLGKPGHVMTPSAKWQTERQLGLNVAFIPRSHAVNYFMNQYYDERIYGFRVGLTDFLEFNLNITYLPDRDRIGIGDRHADIRLRLSQEKGIRPAIVLILSPPGTAANFLGHNALVATKSLKTAELGVLELTAGYSLPYFLSKYPERRNPSIEDNGFAFYPKAAFNIRYLNGFFTAITWRPVDWIGILAEYDGEDIHGGLFFKYKELGSVQVNAYGMKAFGASFNLAFPLQFEVRESRRYGK